MGMLTRSFSHLSFIGAEKTTFPQFINYGQTDGLYRVASLLENTILSDKAKHKIEATTH